MINAGLRTVVRAFFIIYDLPRRLYSRLKFPGSGKIKCWVVSFKKYMLFWIALIQLAAKSFIEQTEVFLLNDN